MKKNPSPRPAAFTFETLEERQFRSVTPAVATLTTTTSLTVSTRSAVLGQPVTVKATITSPDGSPTGGTVELLDNGIDTGLTGTVNHLGYYAFTLDASQSPYVGTHLYRIRWLGNGNFIGSKSRQLIVKTTAPALTTESDGLELATVTKGTGAAATAGETLVVQYTGFDAANGTVFDDSAEHSPGTFSFIVDDSPEQVIAGFDQEALGMKVGETRVAVIPSALGYSDGETRVFIVHLESITAAPSGT